MLDDLDDLVGELLEVGVGAFRLDSGRSVTNEKGSQHRSEHGSGSGEKIGRAPPAGLHHGHQADGRDNLSELAQQASELSHQRDLTSREPGRHQTHRSAEDEGVAASHQDAGEHGSSHVPGQGHDDLSHGHEN